MILFLDFDGVLHPEITGAPDDFVCRQHLWKVLRTCLDDAQANRLAWLAWKDM